MKDIQVVAQAIATKYAKKKWYWGIGIGANTVLRVYTSTLNNLPFKNGDRYDGYLIEVILTNKIGTF